MVLNLGHLVKKKGDAWEVLKYGTVERCGR
jgi:hypothetical protein